MYDMIFFLKKKIMSSCAITNIYFLDFFFQKQEAISTATNQSSAGTSRRGRKKVNQSYYLLL